jgi:hypothetical protein
MTDEATQATVENLRADFLNATTTAERWKVLNRAIDWAVAASENADHYSSLLATRDQKHTVNLTLDSADLVERVRAQIAEGGLARGFGAPSLVGEKVEGEERRIRAGDIVTWDGEEEGWIVEVVRRDGRAVILPLGDDYELARTVVAIEDVWPPASAAGAAV